MTTYNTGNQVPSTAVKDLYDNSQTEDEVVNSDALTTITRTGKMIKTFAGMENDVNEFLLNMGFEATHLIYVDGVPLQVDRPTQLIDRPPSVYKVKMPATFPVMLTGTWATDQLLLVDVGDAALRAELAASSGGSLIGFGDVTVDGRLGQDIYLTDYVPAGADWTAAFTSASSDAAAAGKTLKIPGAVTAYTIGNVTVTCPVESNGAVLSRAAGTSGSWITVAANSVKISGLSIDGNWISGDGIEVDGFSDVEICNNRILRIGGQIIHFNGANNLNVHDNEVPYSTNGITNLMPVDSPDAVGSQGVSIVNNRLEGISGSAIYLAGEQSASDPLYYRDHRLIYDAVVQGNFIRDVSGHGILGQGRRVAIVGNGVFNTGNSSGLQSIVPQGDMCTVIGNVCEGGAGVGIDMGASTNSTVVGNTVRAKGEIGIEMNSCTNVTCTGNTVESCGSTVTGTNSAGISVSQGFFGPSLTSFAVTVSGNTVTAGAAGGKYGVSVDSGVNDVIVCGNHLTLSGTVQSLYVDEASGSHALAYGNITGNDEEALVINYAPNGKFVCRNASGHADFWMSGQGSGTLRWQGNMIASAAPGSFSATSQLAIKDLAGTVFYIPLSNVPI